MPFITPFDATMTPMSPRHYAADYLFSLEITPAIAPAIAEIRLFRRHYDYDMMRCRR